MNQPANHMFKGRLISLWLVCCIAFAVLASPAHAYIGPGAGLGAIAVTVAVILGVVFLIVGLVWFPLKRWIGGRKNQAGSENDPTP